MDYFIRKLYTPADWYQFWIDQQLLVDLLGGLVALGVILGVGYGLNLYIKGKATRMAVAGRNEKLRRVKADYLTEMVEKMVTDGVICDREANEYYQDLFLAFGLGDLIPSRRSQPFIKQQIKRRLNTVPKIRKGRERVPSGEQPFYDKIVLIPGVKEPRRLLANRRNKQL